MYKNKWPDREPTVREWAGRVSAEKIAAMLDMNVNTLRFHCRKHEISLKCQEVTNNALAKARAARQTAKMLEADSPVTLNINIESLWMIPSSSGHRMGSFTP